MDKKENTEAVDSEGTDQNEARELLGRASTELFDGSPEKAALVLGRDASSIKEMLSGNEAIDDDLMMKVRGLLSERTDGSDLNKSNNSGSSDEERSAGSSAANRSN